MSTYPIDQIQHIVKSAAQAELTPRFTNVKREFKQDGSIVTQADIGLQRYMQEQLLHNWPETVLLGEEMSSTAQTQVMASSQPIWCLDPLDGTSNFASGLPCFAISLALLQHGRAVLGVVYDPMRDECFTVERGKGAMLNGQALVLQDLGMPMQQCIANIDFKRLPQALAVRLVQEPPYMSQRNLGAIALEWCWLAAGRFRLYLHGRQQLWDYAAGHLVFQEAGGFASTYEGQAIVADDLQPKSAIAASDQRLFQAWSAWLDA